MAGVRAVAPGVIAGQVAAVNRPEYLQRSGELQTLGQWGAAQPFEPA
jgi:hypothetical protein